MHFAFGRPSRATTIIALFVLACGGDSGGGPIEPVQLTLEPARAEYATFETARVTVRGAPLTAAQYAGTLGAAAFMAQRSTDSTIVFRVPELAAGQHTLTLEIGSRSATTQLSVRATPAVEDPVAYVADVDAVLLLEVEEFEDWYDAQDPTLARFLDPQGFASDVAMMRATLAELHADFQALSPSEQYDVAMMLRAYRAGGAMANGAQLVAYSLQNEELPECQAPDAESVEEMRDCQQQHEAAMVARAKTVQQCDIDFDTRWSEGKYADAIGGNYLAYQCLKAHMLQLKRDVAQTVRAAVFGDFFSSGWLGGDATDARSLALFDIVLDPSYPFVSTASRAYAPPIGFRNLHAEDVGRLAAATELATLMQDYDEGWEALNAAFPRPFVQSPPWLHELYEANTVTLEYDRNALQLGRIEPAAVLGEAAVVEGEWQLTFRGPASTTDPTLPFSFEIIYDNGEFGADTTLVHSELLVHPLGGTWDAQMTLQVSSWDRLYDDRILSTEGVCTGDTELVGERINTHVPVQTDTLRFGGDRLFCDNYDGVTHEIVSVPLPMVYDPADPWDFDDQHHTGALAVDGGSVQVTGELFYAYDASTTTTAITATLVDGRLEGTYDYVQDRGANGRYEASGTFVAVKRQ